MTLADTKSHKWLADILTYMAEHHDCPLCDRTFDTKRGMRTHRGKIHREWLKSKLRELYIRKNLTPKKIGEKLDMARKSVDGWVREFGFKGMDPAKFHFEAYSRDDTYAGYPRWTHTGTGHRVRVHRLQMIAKGADPHKVFGSGWSVDHINGCPIDNWMKNLRLMKRGAHGAKDGHRSSVGHTHDEYLRALVQEPPEWAADLSTQE